MSRYMVITIDTGYQNRPSWLWRTTLLITGSHTHSVLWQARDPGGGKDLFFPFFRLSAQQHPQSDRVYPRCAILQQGMHLNVLVRYIVTGCIFRAPSALWQGQVLTPPPPRYPVEKSSAPPPPGRRWSIFRIGGGGGQNVKNAQKRPTNFGQMTIVYVKWYFYVKF